MYNLYDNLIVEDKRRTPIVSNEYKCAVWTGTEYDTFYFNSDAQNMDAVYSDAWKRIKELYGNAERIVCVLPA